MKSTLIHADERLVVINKAAGISLATRRSEPHGATERLLNSIDADELQMWGLSPHDLFLVHRLDFGTTGLVLLARDARAHVEITRALQEGAVDKTYLALVWGHPRPPEGCYEWPISSDQNDRRRMRVDPSGRPALTKYRSLANCPHVSLLELHPKTGRTHQLRVHLAAAGHWIVGDDLYAGARHRGIKDPAVRTLLNPPHLLLHAWRLDLPESCSAAARNFEAPLPQHFRAVLEALGMRGALP